MAGDREGIHGAFVGECQSERPATLQREHQEQNPSIIVLGNASIIVLTHTRRH
jgi:hypothetical protein